MTWMPRLGVEDYYILLYKNSSPVSVQISADPEVLESGQFRQDCIFDMENGVDYQVELICRSPFDNDVSVMSDVFRCNMMYTYSPDDGFVRVFSSNSENSFKQFVLPHNTPLSYLRGVSHVSCHMYSA